MEVSQHFLVSFVLSFLGSLPLGMITLTITQRTIQNGKNSGTLLALGATVMEFVYTYIALVSLDFFTQNTEVDQYIKIGATCAFFLMAIYFLSKKSKPNPTSASAYDYFDFFRGVVVGAMNLLIVPFWIFIALWLQTYDMRFDQIANILSFSTGSALGALLAFLGYVWLSKIIVSRVQQISQYTDRVVGIIFLGLGFFQLTQLF